MNEINRKKRIGIDMRMAGEGFGIGKYCTDLVSALISGNQFEYVLFFDKIFSRKAYEEFKRLNVECHLLDAKYYSFEEQIKLPLQLSRLKLDLVHFTNFNVPILYPGNFIVTIHDLIHHRFPGTSSRTILWRWGYRLVINIAVRRASKIIAVSESSCRDIIALLGVEAKKISVVHEAVDKSFTLQNGNEIEKIKKKYGLDKPYVIWVGVWRRYKNLELLADAFNRLLSLGLDLQLVLAGEVDKHHPDIADKVRKIVPKEKLVAPGRVTQEDLIALYAGAVVFVNPSLSEGFGLTSVEAQSLGVPVVASDIPVMREVLGESALYFNPALAKHLTSRLNIVLSDKSKREELSKKSLENAKRYSWEATARKTVEIYNSVLNKI